VKTDRSGKLRRCSELPPEPASYSRCLQSSLQNEVHKPLSAKWITSGWPTTREFDGLLYPSPFSFLIREIERLGANFNG
jgi:hypothetical protein